VIKTQVTGLCPGDMYTVFLEFVQVVGQRWKYINSEWSPTTTSDPATKNPFYKHPESPNFGKHWMDQPISFAKIKLTNRPDNPGQVTYWLLILLNLIQLYILHIPIIIIQKYYIIMKPKVI